MRPDASIARYEHIRQRRDPRDHSEPDHQQADRPQGRRPRRRRRQGPDGVVLVPGARTWTRRSRAGWPARSRRSAAPARPARSPRCRRSGATGARSSSRSASARSRRRRPTEPADHVVRRGDAAPRRRCGAAARSPDPTVGLALPAEDAASAEAVAEGALLGAYGYVRYRVASKDEAQGPGRDLHAWSARAGKDKAVKAAVERAQTVAARRRTWPATWVNTPPLDLPPAEFAARRGRRGQRGRPQGRGARREGAEEAGLRRHPRRRPGLVATAAAASS